MPTKLFFLNFLLLSFQAWAQTTVSVIPNRYIVQVEEDHNIFARDGSPVNVHKRMYQHLDARGISYKTHREFESSGLFVGMSISLNDEADYVRVRELPGVKAVYQARAYHRPPYRPLHKREESEFFDPAFSSSEALHEVTGVSKLRALGYTGKGIKVAVIDTGVDYMHPALGQGFGSGFKVFTGFDFAGDIDDPSEEAKPDNDPMDCDGHGTHVAGIIAANGGVGPFNITGVAPDASLSAYKIGGCVGSFTDEAIMDALLRAEKDGNDVLNLSLGGPKGFEGGAVDVVATGVAQRGKIVVFAAGNNGKDGSWLAASPSTAQGVISVGSIDSPGFPVQAFQVEGADVPRRSIPVNSIFQLTNHTDRPLSLFAIPSKAGEGYLSNSVLVFKSIITCPTQYQAVIAKKPKVILIYGDEQEFGSITAPEKIPNISVLQIDIKDGVWLTEQWTAKKDISVTFPGSQGLLINHLQDTAGFSSAFSTYGPTFSMSFKPSLAAPGGQILSTYPLKKGAYAVLPGTSMASPYLAGCAALLLQVRGKTPEVAKQAINWFESTAFAVPAIHSDEKLIQTVTIAGAGSVDAFAAAFVETYVSPTELLANDTAHFKGDHEFTVTNFGKKEKKYSLTHEPAGTAITIIPGSVVPAMGPVPLVKSFATVDLSMTNFTLAPGKSQKVTVKIIPPKGLDPKTLPVYSGFIAIQPEGESDSEEVHVSYMGLAGTLLDEPIFDPKDPPAIIVDEDEKGQPVVQTKAMEFDLAGEENFPFLLVRLSFGSPLVNVDLVDPSFELSQLSDPAKITKSPVLGKLLNATNIGRNVNQTSGTPIFRLPLNNSAIVDDDEHWMPDGTYKVLVSALRVNGDPENPAHYDTWLSYPLTLKFSTTTRQALTDAKAAKSNDGGDNRPFYKKIWFIVVAAVAGLLVVGAVIALIFLRRRKRNSTIRSEAPFLPPMGAYTPLKNETSHTSYSDTSYKEASY